MKIYEPKINTISVTPNPVNINKTFLSWHLMRWS